MAETAGFRARARLNTRYATLPAGADKEQALLALCQAFHPYLMKYLAMICRGHVPVWKGRINRDAKNFMRYFLPPGSMQDQATIGKAIRHLHLAFKSMETEEIYEVLMEQFLRAAAKYDPHYSDKVKEVVEVIENALSSSPFGAVDVDRHLEFRCHRYLRLLCRRGFLTSESREAEKYALAQIWPAESYNGAAVADHLPKGLTAFPMGPRSVLKTSRTEHPHSNRRQRSRHFTREPNPMNETNNRSVSFADFLRQRRTALRLRQAEIAAELRVEPETVGHWESGRRRMEFDKVPRMAAILKLNAKDLCRLALSEWHPRFYDSLFGTKQPQSPRCLEDSPPGHRLRPESAPCRCRQRRRARSRRNRSRQPGQG